jgi:hypothetical protein
MTPLRLNSLEDLNRLPGALDPEQAEETIKATLHLAGWQTSLNKVEVAGWLLAILAAVQPDPPALSIEIRRALLGWAAASADPENMGFMELWCQIITQLNLDQASHKLLDDTRQRSREPAFADLIDKAINKLKS